MIVASSKFRKRGKWFHKVAVCSIIVDLTHFGIPPGNQNTIGGLDADSITTNHIEDEIKRALKEKTSHLELIGHISNNAHRAPSSRNDILNHCLWSCNIASTVHHYCIPAKNTIISQAREAHMMSWFAAKHKLKQNRRIHNKSFNHCMILICGGIAVNQVQEENVWWYWLSKTRKLHDWDGRWSTPGSTWFRTVLMTSELFLGHGRNWPLHDILKCLIRVADCVQPKPNFKVNAKRQYTQTCKDHPDAHKHYSRSESLH